MSSNNTGISSTLAAYLIHNKVEIMDSGDPTKTLPHFKHEQSKLTNALARYSTTGKRRCFISLLFSFSLRLSFFLFLHEKRWRRRARTLEMGPNVGKPLCGSLLQVGRSQWRLVTALITSSLVSLMCRGISGRLIYKSAHVYLCGCRTFCVSVSIYLSCY